MNTPLPRVSVIVVNYNGMRFVRDCFGSLARTDYPPGLLEILCVDNGSTDGSLELTAREFPGVILVSSPENNYALANNLGIEKSTGDYVVLLNSDAKVDPGWLPPLVRAMEQDASIGAAQPKLCFFDGTLQSLGHVENPDFYWVDRGAGEDDHGQYGADLLEADSLCGACMMIRKTALDQVGLLDPDFVMFVEDVDLCVRLKARGFRLVCAPESRVLHFNHGAVKTEDKARLWVETNRLVLIAKHWPDKLAENLLGRGFFLGPGEAARRAFFPAVSKACAKMLACHGPEVCAPVLAEIFTKLSKALDPEKDALVRQAAERYKERDRAAVEQENRLYAEIDRLRDLILEREEEIRAYRQSLGFRFLLKPLQNAADTVRSAIPPLAPKAAPPPFLPHVVSMKFTNRCNLKCRMCGIWSQPQEPELTTGQWKDAISRVFDWLGPYTLDIAGGEPLMREDNDELTAHAASLGIFTALLSNGTLITKARARKLLDSGLDSIHLSLDSLKPQVFDHMRGAPGTFAKVTRAIKHLQELRRYRDKEFGIGIAAIVMGVNLDELADIAGFVKNGGADYLSFQPLAQAFHERHDPNWFKTNKHWISDTDKLDKVVDELLALKTKGYPIGNYTMQLRYLKEYFRDPDAFAKNTQCYSGDRNFIVRDDGDVLLCWNLPPVGNIFNDSPARIWNSEEARKRREQIARCTRTCRILSCHFKPEGKS